MNVVMKGIDVSGWQGTPDYSKIKAAGVDFVIVKLTDELDVAKNGPDNIKRAKAAGLHVGAYHFLHSVNVAQAEAEARFFLSTVKPLLPLDMPVSLDIEEFYPDGKTGFYASHGVTAATIRAMVQAWIKIVLAANFYVVVYTNRDWALNVLQVTTRPKDYARVGIWYARYLDSVNDVKDVAELGRVAGIVQHSSTGRVNGINGAVDLDVAQYNYPAIIKAQGQNGFPKPAVITLDTNGIFYLKKGSYYQLKSTGPEGHTVSTGNGDKLLVIPRACRQGNNDFWFLVAVGNVGEEVGVYTAEKGAKAGTRQLIVRIK